MYCGRCGKAQEEDAVFCEYCGAKLMMKRKRKGPKIILGFLVVSVVVCVGLLISAKAGLNCLEMQFDDSGLYEDAAAAPVISSDRIDFFIGEQDAAAKITVTLKAQTDGEVRIIDENDEEIFSWSADETAGKTILTAQLPIDTSEAVNLKYRAQADQLESSVLTIYVAPEVTYDMFQVCAEVARELDEYLLDEGYERIDDEALELAYKWLEDDKRVDGVTMYDSGLLYHTKDFIVGGLMNNENPNVMGASEGFSEEGIPLTAYAVRESGDDTRMNLSGGDSLINDQVLILRPLVDHDEKLDATAHKYEENGEEIADFLDSEADIRDDQEALYAINLKEMVNYGVILFQCHGGVIAGGEEHGFHDDKVYEAMIFYNGDYIDELSEDAAYEMGLDLQYFHGDSSDPTTVRLYMSGTYMFATASYFMGLYQGEFFDNTYMHMGTCWSAEDLDMVYFFVNHGASAYVGYRDNIVVALDGLYLDSSVGTITNYIKKERRTKTVEEMTTESKGLLAGGLKMIAEGVYNGLTAILSKILNEQGDVRDQMMYVTSNSPNYALLGDGDVKGQVVNAEDDPIEDAHIEVLRWLNQDYAYVDSFDTDEDGNFEIKDLTRGIYVLSVSHESYTAKEVWFDLSEDSFDGTIVLENTIDYYQYIKDELEPVYGLIDPGTENGVASDFSQYGWDKRSGIVSAYIDDFDGDSVDDMALIRADRADINAQYVNAQEIWNMKYIMEIYSVDDGEIMLMDSIDLASCNNCEIKTLDFTAKAIDDGTYIFYQEEYSKGCLVDYKYPDYYVYAYENGKIITKVYESQSRGGTSEIGYSVYTWNKKTKSLDEELLIEYVYGEQNGTYRNSGLETGEILIRGLVKAGLPEQYGKKSSNGFATFLSDPDLENIFKYSNECSSYSHFSSTIADETSLREILETYE